MPRLPAFTPAELVKVLERLGFKLDRTRGSHRIYLHPETRRRVVVPFHRADLPRGTVQEILRQAGLSRDELAGLL
ncbi:type II toxin-antitoxin system HicA family toxin [candidate division WOR-3 bacterium]|nr:type II toxin-antitoxin system HicA family toxin [candidate division WOR-3 bacterium]